MWLKQKTKNQQRSLLKKLVDETKNDNEFKTRFIEGILLPGKLNA